MNNNAFWVGATIGLRNIKRQKRRSLLTALTLTVGFTLSSVAISISDGSYNRIIALFTNTRLGQIQIHAEDYLARPSLYKTILHPNRIGDKLQNMPQVRAWTPRFYGAGLISWHDQTAAVRIIGIDPQQENRTTTFSKQIVQGRGLEKNGEIIIGVGLRQILKVSQGDSIILLSQAADGSMANDLFQVVGFLDSGNAIENRSSIFLSLEDAQSFFVLPDAVHEIVVVTQSLNNIPQIAKHIRHALLDALDVQPWQEFANWFYRAMQADRKGMWIMILIILLIVGVSVLNAILMTTLERRREYGLLKALGTQPQQIIFLILSEVFYLAILSIAAGMILVFLANTYLSTHGIAIGEGFTYGGMKFDRLHSQITPLSLWLPAATLLVTALLVSLFPAAMAAQTDPAQAMRKH